MNAPIEPWNNPQGALNQKLKRKRAHLSFYTICPFCCMYSLRANYTRSQSRIGGKYWKCDICKLIDPNNESPDGVSTILGIAEQIKGYSDEQIMEWREKLKNASYELEAQIDFKPSSTDGKERLIACKKGTNQPLFVQCPTCGILGAEIRLDKRGRKYITHHLCQGRIFTQTEYGSMALTGFCYAFAEDKYISLFDEWQKVGEKVWKKWTIRKVEVTNEERLKIRPTHSTERVSEAQ